MAENTGNATGIRLRRAAQMGDIASGRKRKPGRRRAAVATHQAAHKSIRHSIQMMFIMLAACCLLPAAFAAQPTDIQVTYDVYKARMKIGQIEERFTRDKDRYRLTSTTSAIGWLAIFNPGKIVISSRGLVGTRGLQPEHFSDHRENNEQRDRSAELDWTEKQITLIQRGQRTTQALPEGTQDRLSAMYQFMFLTLKPGATLSFPMTNGGKLDQYQYVIGQGEPLKTAAGDFDTLYLDSQAKKGESRTEIWLATRRNNLPCKMTITEANGDQLTQILSKIVVTP